MTRTPSGRPDFKGFVEALKDEASWIQTLHANDKTGQVQADAEVLLKLSEQVETVGIRMSYIAPDEGS